MLIKKEAAWVVLADGASARIYEQLAGQQLKQLKEFSSAESHKLTHELVSDRAGRAIESVGMARHAMEEPTDPQAVEKAKFLKSVAGYINSEALAGKFGALTLCAPPRVLGELRQMLDQHAKKLVKTEIGKDLIKTPILELMEHLAAAANK